MIHSLMLLLFIVSSSRELSSPTSRCSCVSSLTCTTAPYGRLALDIALLGVHAPCPLPGQVLCCDRSGLEDLYGDSEPRPLILEQVHLVGNGNVMVPTVPETEFTDEDFNHLHVDEGDEIQNEVNGVNENEKRPESYDYDKLKEEKSLNGVDDGLSSKCGCIPAEICPQQFKHAGIDQCDETAGLVLCCIDVVDEGEPQHEDEIEDSLHVPGPLHEVLEEYTAHAGDPQYGDPVGATNLSITVPLGDHTPVVELNEKQPSPTTPPLLSLVPCTKTCTGISYSPLNTQHKELYGFLAECSTGMVRCILHLDLQQFIHSDNFNLPIFNLPNFIRYLSIWSGDNESEITKLDDSTIDVDQHVINPNRKGDNIIVNEHLGKTESVLTEELENTGVSHDYEIPRLKSPRRRFFTSSKVKKKVEDFDIKNPKRNQARQLQESLPFSKTDLSSVRNSKISSLLAALDNQPVSISPISSKYSDLRSKTVQRDTPPVTGSRKGNSKLSSNTSHEILAKRRKKDLAEKLIKRMTENLANGKSQPQSHMPELKDITGVEIVIPNPKPSPRVMVHMDKDMMEKKVDEDKLLSVLQAVLIALE